MNRLLKQHAAASTEEWAAAVADDCFPGVKQGNSKIGRFGSTGKIGPTELEVTMLRKSFFNTFSTVLLALAALALAADLVMPGNDGTLFTPAVLAAIWLAGGIVRYAYEAGSEKAFERHMAESRSRRALKLQEGLWVPVTHTDLQQGDIIRLSEGEPCSVDAIVLSESGLMVSESSITGESGSERKIEGQLLRAGCIVTSGVGTAKVDRVENPSAPRARTERRKGFDDGARGICLVFLRFAMVVVLAVLTIRGIALGDLLQAFFFALSAAVGLIPEMLPVVTSACLSGSAQRLRKRKVIVKDVDSMEALGDMDVLCMDKTGTLTEDKAVLEYYTDVLGNEYTRTLRLAQLECLLGTRADNQLEAAIVAAGPTGSSSRNVARHLGAFDVVRTDPFDYASRCSGAVFQGPKAAWEMLDLPVPDAPDRALSIVKGEVEAVCSRCSFADFRGQLVHMGDDERAQALALADDMRADGIKVLAVAYGLTGEWDGLALCGFLAFFDAPKPSAKPAVDSLRKMGVEPKVLTGDSVAVARSVATRLGIDASVVVTGSDISLMSESDLMLAASDCSVFAELGPKQKAQVVEAVRSNGNTVGYMGDGLNDLLALRASDLSIVTESGSPEAKDASDIVLLERDLGVVAHGAAEGRCAFANASKYIRIAASSNLGNILSVAVASLFLPFLPATAAQLLVLNLAYDLMCLSLPWDNVDPAETEKPRCWSSKGLAGFMAAFAPVSTAFDLATFAVLFFLVCPAVCGGGYWQLDAAGQAVFVSLFQAGWLLECAWTQSLILLVMRTRGGKKGSRPSAPLVAAVVAVLIISALVLAGPVAGMLGMAPVPLWCLAAVAFAALAYAGCATIVKRAYLSRHDRLF